MMLARHGIRIPDWALPYVGGVLSMVGVFLIVLSVRAVLSRKAESRKRWGDFTGYRGLAACFFAFGIALLMDIDFGDGPVIVFAAGFVATGLGGALAGWTARPPMVG